jgi:hypothetical protein
MRCRSQIDVPLGVVLCDLVSGVERATVCLMQQRDLDAIFLMSRTLSALIMHHFNYVVMTLRISGCLVVETRKCAL